MSGKWIQQLKPGDKCFVTQPYGRESVPVIVSRVTNTVVFVKRHGCEQEQAHRRVDGRTRGGDIWSTEYLVEDSPELQAKYRLALAKRKCTNLRGLIATPQTIEECEAMIAALLPFVKGKEGAA